MPKITGASTKVKIGKESSFGTPGDLTHILPITSEALSDNVEMESSEALYGKRGKKDLNRNKEAAGGNIDLEVWSKSIGLILFGALGKATLDTDKTILTPIDQIANPTDDLPSFTIEKNQGGQTFLYPGSKINTLDIDLTVGQRPKLSISVESKKEEIASGTDAATVEDFGNKFVFKDLKFYKDEFVTSASRWSNMKISLNNNLDGDDYRPDGTNERSAIDPQDLEITGSLDLIFDATSVSGEYTAFKNDQDFSIGVLLENGTGEKIEIFIPKAKFTSIKHDTGGKEKINLSGEWEAILPDDGTDLIKITDYMNSTGTY